MLRPLAIALPFLLTLAGCLGTDEPLDTAAAQADAPTATNATAEADASTNATVVELVPIPVAYSGSTPTGVCAFMVGQCEFTSAGSESTHSLDTAGKVMTHLAVQFTYGEQKPGMAFYVALCEDVGSHCTEYQTGPSPLVLEYDLESFPPGTAFTLSAGSVGGQAEAAGVITFAETTFDVKGTLTSVR